jgi:hypothetical protein
MKKMGEAAFYLLALNGFFSWFVKNITPIYLLLKKNGIKPLNHSLLGSKALFEEVTCHCEPVVKIRNNIN